MKSSSMLAAPRLCLRRLMQRMTGQLCMDRTRRWTVRAVHGFNLPAHRIPNPERW